MQTHQTLNLLKLKENKFSLNLCLEFRAISEGADEIIEEGNQKIT